MIQLIIIDDNPIILKGLELRIPCHEFGLELAGTYQSAIEALAVMRPEQAYVVLTDIAMPDMDGLDFIEVAQKRFPLCAFICITGYEKIEYMHRAIECQVISFLNKPIDDSKLHRALKKAVDSLYHRMEYNTLFFTNRLQYNSEILSRLLDGEMKELLHDELQMMGGLQKEIGLRVITGSFLQRAADVISADCTPEELKGMYPVNNLLFSMNNAALMREMNVSDCICVTRQVGNDLRSALYELVLDAHEKIYGFRPGLNAGGSNGQDAVLSRIKLLLQMRRADDAAECAVAAMDDMFRSGRTLEELGAYVCALEQILGNDERNLRGFRFPMLTFASLDDVKRWIREGAERVCPRESDAAAALYRYISENVASAMSLQTLGKVVHMHPNYIGKLIKDRYSISFNDLVNKLRIELSMELLKADPKMNLNVLAERVGYADPKYFSRVFKLRTGMTPSAFVRGLEE